MTRPTASDRACLEAQVQAQVAQRLTAELAVSCPDCGVEPGRACRDSFDRAVKSHLGRVVAANRRDTEPCPAPSEGAFKRDLHAMIEAGLEQEWLTRAAARAFARGYLDEVAPYLSAETLLGIYGAKTPTAPDDSAPSPAASAPVAVSSTRPVCACGQTIWRDIYVEGSRVCGDCFGERFDHGGKPAPLDKRIAETKSDDAAECAWSTPTSDGEGWR